MKTKYLLYTGIVIPIIFWLTTIVSGFILGNYNHLSRMVSELGAIGTASQYVFMTGLLLCSVLSILFIIGLYKFSKLNQLSILPILLIFLYTFSIGGAALFPLPLRLHGILGMPSILLPLSPLLSLLFWRKLSLPNFKVVSILSLFIMMLGFLVFMPDFLGEFIGLKQRFFHLGWSIWFIGLCISFIRSHKPSTTINN